MNSSRWLALGLTASLWAPSFASGATWIEAGDAGQSLATANRVHLPAPARILGDIANPNDADMFALFLRAGVPFSATAVAAGGTTAILDTQLFLFDASGLGLRYNDDKTVIDAYSHIAFTPSVSGLYFLGVSAAGFNPTDAAGSFIYVRDPFAPAAAPGASAFGALASWAADGTGVTDQGQFQVDVMGASAVPEPGPAVLLALGLAGLSTGRRFTGRR